MKTLQNFASALLCAALVIFLSTSTLRASTVYSTSDNSVASGDYYTDGNVLFGTQTVYFGTSGVATATLTINSSNAVTSYNFYLGPYSGSDGTLNCYGYLQCYNLVAAQDSGSVAAINLYAGKLYTGSGGTGSLYIGQYGNAKMTMTGGETQFADTIIAEYSTSTSSLTLSGGTINCSASLHVGMGGTGTMTMTGGTVNTSGSFVIAMNDTGNGTFNMSGGTINSAKDFYVAASGTGVFNMTGGTINCSVGSYIGAWTGGTGTATVSGSGTAWKTTGALTIGGGTSGKLTIESGALVTADSLSIGSGGAVYINNGYLALAGDETSAIATLLDGGSKIYVYVGGSYVALTTANYTDYVIYTSDIATDYADLATTYGLTGAYTVVVPEPAACALFFGVGALSILMIRRRNRCMRQVLHF